MEVKPGVSPSGTPSLGLEAGHTIDYGGDACLTMPYGNVDLALLMVASNFVQKGLMRTFSLV